MEEECDVCECLAVDQRETEAMREALPDEWDSHGLEAKVHESHDTHSPWESDRVEKT